MHHKAVQEISGEKVQSLMKYSAQSPGIKRLYVFEMNIMAYLILNYREKKLHDIVLKSNLVFICKLMFFKKKQAKQTKKSFEKLDAPKPLTVYVCTVSFMTFYIHG